MFRGASSISLDAKGRIAIPKRYRPLLCAQNDNQLVVTVDIKSACLLLYPLDAWQEVEQKLATLSDTQPSERAIKRLLLGYAADVEMDRMGRVLLPPPLRQYAQLDKQLMLVGQLNKFEIWSESNWQQQIADSQTALEAEAFIDNQRLQEFAL
ncbi:MULTISPECIES: division/cell wall cluster transcriptional repressor MraZ [Ferrimonas]|uniref:division/cell wall cluster transcriptional repressor MraZ n=1 Tax=Ferrimonas TaxID=44011 RepID=UPI00042563D2|nr:MULTISPECIES: division/cell wall cluster transcriptional repressor MraZ [Ferrimonas]USD37217.1 division/cell wall cluster transcriptional repressor MraZ [Ferrimonas sp. SCSIO 43195]